MKLKKEQITNGILLVLLALFLFTPLGFHVRVQVSKWISFSPSKLDIEKQEVLSSYTWQLRDLKNDLWQFEDTKGKVVVVNFWATWCPPCVAEMPDLQRLYDAYGDKVVFAFVASDELEKVKAFLEKKRYNLPVYFNQTTAPIELEHPTIPTTYIIDRAGKIVLKETGAADWDSEEVFELLDELLAN